MWVLIPYLSSSIRRALTLALSPGTSVEPRPGRLRSFAAMISENRREIEFLGFGFERCSLAYNLEGGWGDVRERSCICNIK